MTNRYAIVSTYPKHGSRNVGDHLISASLETMIRETEPGAQIDHIWRAKPWESARSIIREVDHVFFACLAIRPTMADQEYPFLRSFLDSATPFSVHAAGTDLPVHRDSPLLEAFEPEVARLLQDTSEKAAVFTTRGVLSQWACEQLGLQRCTLAGDIAFADDRFRDREFMVDHPIRRIVVSDPHRPAAYRESLVELIAGLRREFAAAEFLLVLHGVNPLIERTAEELGMDVFPAYENPESGLEIYDEADLHVGFRVHGHVSALKRRRYSYLLEQDGRGCDYGLTIDRRISVPHLLSDTRVPTALSLARRLLGRMPLDDPKPRPSGVAQILALVRSDTHNGFQRFAGLERTIRRYVDLNRVAVRTSLAVAR